MYLAFDEKVDCVLQTNMVCDMKEYHAYADMIFMGGLLVGSIVTGLFSDRLVSVIMPSVFFLIPPPPNTTTTTTPPYLFSPHPHPVFVESMLDSCIFLPV